jgi:hypothetical protein
MKLGRRLRCSSVTRHFDRRQDDRARSDGVNIHVPVCPELELVSGDGVFVRRTHQGGAEVSCIVGIGHANGRCGAQLTKKWAKPDGQANEVVRRVGQDRVLNRAFR